MICRMKIPQLLTLLLPLIGLATLGVRANSTASASFSVSTDISLSGGSLNLVIDDGWMYATGFENAHPAYIPSGPVTTPTSVVTTLPIGVSSAVVTDPGDGTWFSK